MIAQSSESARASSPRRDHISTEQGAFLRGELARQPEVRPEVVARGQRLAADRAYPGPAVILDVAGQILAAPDRSEDGT